MQNWNSIADFFLMNGHGYYVWWAYGAFTAGVVWELCRLVARRREVCRRLIREARAAEYTLEK